MWSFEHSVDTSARPDAVWSFYSDVSTWPSWNSAVEHVELDGSFAAGVEGRLTPPGQEPLPFRIVTAEAGEGYVSETDIAETVTLRLTNNLAELPDGGTTITHRADLVGPAADHFGESFGPQLTQGVPTSMRELADRAARISTS